MKKFNSCISLGLIILANLCSPVQAEWGSGKYSSPLSVEIQLKKDSFRINEPVEGLILIKNTYPSSLPAIFTVRIYQEKRMHTEFTTSIKRVPLGTTEFTFKGFGIPHFNNHVGTEGKWRIYIVQQDRDQSYAAEAELTIVPPAIREDTEHKFMKKRFKY